MWSFRTRLLFLLIGLVAGAETVTLVTALARTSTTERQRADEQLVAGASIARRQIEYRERQLAAAVGVLALDYALAESLTSGHTPTVQSALLNHSRRIGATLTIALDLDGKVIAGGGDDVTGSDPELARAIKLEFGDDTASSHFVTTTAGVHQVFVAPVMAPDEIGRIAMGFAVDSAFARDLRELVGAEVAFVVMTPAGRQVLASTLPALRGKDLDHGGERSAARVGIVGGEEFLTTLTSLSDSGRGVELALLMPMSQVMAPYNVLARNLALIIGLTLAMAVLAGVYLGRSAARPVQQLAAGAARVAAGDYSQHVNGSGGQELAHLADAFNSMQHGIAERESRLLHVARHDAATGLPNRLFAEEWLAKQLETLPASHDLGVAMVSLTNLREISANLGFDIVGQLTRQLAQSIERWNGGQGLLARVDAAHFIVARPGTATGPMKALVEQLHHVARTPLHSAGVTLQASVVVGAALARSAGMHASELLRCAEAAVQIASERQQPHAFFDPGSDELQRRRLRLGAELPRALEGNQLYLKFQPKVRMSDRRTVGVEALVRWQHPEFGEVSPAEFVPIAERTGTSGLLTRWVLREGLAQLAAWHAQGIDIDMSVNLSAADILNPELLHYILGALRDARLAPGALTLEITESVLLNEPDVARRNIEMLRLAGVRFSIDDFGTGYSSLSQLSMLAADELKIDRSFVQGLRDDPAHGALIRAIVQLGHGLGLKTIAEGVESEEQWEPLAQLGCDQVQGYLTGAPRLASELTPALAAAARDAAPDGRTASLRVLELRRNG